MLTAYNLGLLVRVFDWEREWDGRACMHLYGMGRWMRASFSNYTGGLSISWGMDESRIGKQLGVRGLKGVTRYLNLRGFLV